MTREQPTKKTPVTQDFSPAGSTGIARAVWLALTVLVLVQGAVIAVERSLLQSTVRPLRHAMSDLPLTIGTWSGKDAELDTRTFAAVGADQQINRIWTNPTGDAIVLHCAAWVSADDWTPHVPELCYTGNGWALVQSHLAILPEQPNVSIMVQTYEKSGQRVMSAYWYQLNDRAYVDRNSARRRERHSWAAANGRR